MWKNSDEFLLLSVWMLYVISELMPEMRGKQTFRKAEMKTERFLHRYQLHGKEIM